MQKTFSQIIDFQLGHWAGMPFSGHLIQHPVQLADIVDMTDQIEITESYLIGKPGISDRISSYFPGQATGGQSVRENG